MKPVSTFVFSLALFAASSVNAQDLAVLRSGNSAQPREFERGQLNVSMVQTNYLDNLNSTVPGVVESALGHVTLMRIAYPKANLKKLEAKILELAATGATKSIRFKAFIAMQVFAAPAAYKANITNREHSGDGLLEEIALAQ